MKRAFQRLCCLAVAAIITTSAFAGCVKSDDKANNSSDTTTPSTVATTTSAEDPKGIKIDPSKKVTLKYFTAAAVNKTELDQTLPDFNKKYPNIKVEPVIINAAEYDTKVKTSIVAGEQVDVIEVSSFTLERAQAASMYTPMDELVKTAGMDISKEYGEYADQLKVDGVLYAIPKYLAPAGIWYNKKHFDEAKIPYPTADWTWDEFFDIAKKLTVKDASGKVTRYGAYDWNFSADATSSAIFNTAMYGGWQLLNDDGTLNIDDARFRKSLDYYQKATMVDKSMPDIATISAEKYHYMYDMYKGKWSMLISARNTAVFFDVHRTNGQLPEADDEAGIYQIAPMPRWDANSPKKLSADSVTGDAIAKGTKYPEEAFVFVQWHTTDSLVLSSKVSHRVPASKTLDINTLIENWTYYKNKDAQIVKGKDRADLFKEMLDPEIKPIFSGNTYKYGYSKKMTDELNKELSLLFTGSKDTDKAIADAKAAMLEIYEKEAKK
jgi:multiple sugar transport system substrate-binding protein